MPGSSVAPKAEFAHAIAIGDLQRAAVNHLGRRPRRMLDAGCGSRRPSGLLADYVVGFDPDPDPLERNPCVDERIVGAIPELPKEGETFDVVVAWNVLEHVADPVGAIRKLGHAVAPGGLLVVAVPNASSVRGHITRLTPTWFHRAVLRHVLRGRSAAPYTTTISDNTKVASLVGAAADCDLRLIHRDLFVGYHEMRLLELHPIVGRGWLGLTKALSNVTGERLDHRTDVHLVFARQALSEEDS